MKIRNLIYFVLVVTSHSCTKLSGKIETRNKGKVYLVNTSTTNAFKFTVKTTIIINDSIYNYQTQIVELAPGDEMLLGNKYEVSAISYPDKNVALFVTYKPNKEEIKKDKKPIKQTSNPFEEYLEKSVRRKDTIINGETLKYYYETITTKDTLHPYPINHYKYNYEVRGQVEVKFKR